MPRDGSGIYHRPPGTDAVPDTSIESTKYNANVADVEQDLNTPRPIVAGGTGANNAHDAMLALKGEIAGQIVTNFDADPIVAGSFSAAAGATSAPSANACSGMAVVTDANNMLLLAFDAVADVQYTRAKVAGTWGAWVALPTEAGSDAAYVFKAGDTMTGNLTIAPAAGDSIITLNKSAAGLRHYIFSQTDGKARWALVLGDNSAETGSNAGSNLLIGSYNDDGTPLGQPLSINRATAEVTLATDPLSPLGVVTKRYSDKIFTAGMGLTAAQQQQARQNIYAAPFDAMAYNGLQCNGTCEISQERGNVGYQIPMTGALSFIQDGWCVSASAASTLVLTAFSQNTGGPAGTPYNVALGASVALASLAANDYTAMGHFIEGIRTRRLNWGTAGAIPITIGFWVLSSGIAGTACLSVRNSDYTRCYVVEFPVIPGWVYITATIPGDTTGTWLKDNGVGIRLNWSFGAGSTNRTATPGVWSSSPIIATPAVTNFFATTGNTVYLTGLLVLPGNEAPRAAQIPMIMRSYDQELPLCQRYYYQIGPSASAGLNMPAIVLTDGAVAPIPQTVNMRALPAFSCPLVDGNFTNSGAIGAGQWGLQCIGVAACAKSSGTITVQGYAPVAPGGYIAITGATFNRTGNALCMGPGLNPIKLDARMI